MYQPGGDNGEPDPVNLTTATWLGQAADMVNALGSGLYGITDADSTHSDDPNQNQLWRLDKTAIEHHVLFPLLTCLLEKCELATCSPRHDKIGMAVCSAASFKEDLADFIKLNATQTSFYTPNAELDEMLLAIRVLHIHLMELEKVHELCDNFCNRYVERIKNEMPQEVGMDERSTSTRPTSSLSSPTHTAASSASPAVATPMNSMMPMYPSSYDNHVVGSADSNLSHNSSMHSGLPNQQSLEHQQKCETPLALNGSNGNTDFKTNLTGHDLSASHSQQNLHDPSTNGYHLTDDQEYKPQIGNLDGGSDGGGF
uniref:MEIS N-terminal domain-containing protein n=1 Tax=Panagrolaimus sp. JU765 TaxID=591449 RepID=A0AC34QWU0_9BILA